MKKLIPNLITLLNLLFGCIALVAVFRKQFDYCFYCLLLAAAADFLDGFVARLLGVQSDLGKELDSLADVVTFGVVPGFVMYNLIVFSIGTAAPNIQPENALFYTAYLGLLVPLASAYRLAKFNTDSRQAYHFIGLPTPANGIFMAGLPLALKAVSSHEIFQWLGNPFFLCLLTVVFSWLLISEIPLMALKFKGFSWQSNKEKYSMVLLALLPVVFFGTAGASLAILIYIMFCLIFPRFAKG